MSISRETFCAVYQTILKDGMRPVLITNGGVKLVFHSDSKTDAYITNDSLVMVIHTSAVPIWRISLSKINKLYGDLGEDYRQLSK